MKLWKPVILTTILLGILFGVNSCKKIQEDELLSGLWRFNAVYVNDSTSNFMLNFPHFPNGNDCCAYRVDFQRDNIVIAYYLTYDTFNYVVAGTWQLNHYNEMYMKFDNYFDGTFTVKKKTNKDYDLSSDANHLKVFDGINPVLDTTKMKIEMERI